MVSLPSRAVRCVLSPIPQACVAPLYLSVLIDTDDNVERNSYWKLRTHYQERSDVIACSERYLLLVIALVGSGELA
jgi:hypothetical protein